jgi:hypothetical protein
MCRSTNLHRNVITQTSANGGRRDVAHIRGGQRADDDGLSILPDYVFKQKEMSGDHRNGGNE